MTRRQNALALFQAYAEKALASGAAPKGLEQAFAATLAAWRRTNSAGRKALREQLKSIAAPSS
jgi:hypothetical protein